MEETMLGMLTKTARLHVRQKIAAVHLQLRHETKQFVLGNLD
jgi:hypothetical protein